MPKETNKQSKSSNTTKKKTTKSSTTKITKPKVPLKINTSKLKVGMTVKNYKELCELLKQDFIQGGNARKAQLKEFECYFDWEKSGQKFIITDIYDTPLEKDDKRKFGNNSIYAHCIEVILLQYLSKQDGFTSTLTKKNWWELLGITNHNYGKTSEKDLIKLDQTVTSFEVRNFYQRCNKRLEQILFSALNNLKSRKLIIYEPETVIVEYDNHGNEISSIATDDEKKLILQTERYVLHTEMGYEKMFQVFVSGRQKEYYEKVNELLLDQFGWDHCYKQLKIIYTPEDIKEALPETEIYLQKQLLNENVVTCINENAQSYYDKCIEKYNKEVFGNEEDYWGELPAFSMENNKNIWKIPDTYLTAQSILTNELIKIGHKDLEFSAEDFIKSNEDDPEFSF